MNRSIGYINALREIVITLRKRKINTLLSMGGIFLGVFILLVSISLYETMVSGSLGKSIDWDVTILYATTDGNFSMEYDDIQKVRRRFPDSDCGCVEIPAGYSVINGPDTRSTSAKVCYMMPEYYGYLMLGMVHGRFINRDDMESRRRICVLGKNVSDKLFGEDTDPCGNIVEIDNVCYTVAGVMYKPVTPIEIYGNEEEMVFIPYTVADVVFGLDGRITQMIAFIPAEDDAQQFIVELGQYIKRIHEVEDKEYEVTVKDGTDPIRQWIVAFLGGKYLVFIVGIGMIIAGLLNLFNIMRVSIVERREEFGIRLCIGATPDFIAKSVAMEGMFMATAAGFAGILLALLAVVAAQNLISIELLGKPFIPLLICIAVFLIMVAGGALIGYLCIKDTVKQEVTNLLSNPE